MTLPCHLVFTQFCPGSIGEQIVQIPFFHLLRSRNPEVPIVGVAPEQSYRLLEGWGALDHVHVYSNKAGPGEMARLVGALRRVPCSRAYQHRHLSTRTTLLARLSTGSPLIGFRGNWNHLFQQESHVFDKATYIACNYLKLLGLDLPEFSRDFPRENDGYLLVVPGGRVPWKKYPLKQYLEVARTLSGRLPVRFLLGPDMSAERDELSRLPDPFTVHFAEPIERVEELIRRSALTLANDCGPAHFAHIYDVPRVSIFNSGINDAHWFHAGERGKLILSPRRDEIHQIPPQQIVETVEELL